MVAANASQPAQQTVQLFRCFGGGYQLEIDGDFIGIFETAKSAHEFAAAWLLSANKAVRS